MSYNAEVNQLNLIMPTRNVEGMVGKILTGITAKQWDEIGKFVVIDNGSVDATVLEVQKFITDFGYPHKIHVHANGKDLGYGFSINWGLSFLSGGLDSGYIGILHADDQFSSKELIDLYISHQASADKDILLVRRKRDMSASFNFRQAVRNIGNFYISLVGRLSTKSELYDFNTPFFLMSKDVSRQLVTDYTLGNDILFHPRLNLILASQFNCKYQECNWKRASRTTRIPIILIAMQIVYMYFKFGVCHRIMRMNVKRSYLVASNYLKL
jgi:glycosyltransferase involved in cell wall biosynthesis